MKKKILYCVNDLAYKRVFESFCEKDNVVQAIAHKSTVKNSPLSDYKIKKIMNFGNEKEMQKIINNFCPSAYVQPDLSDFHKKLKLPVGCKRVFVSHGIVAKKMVDISRDLCIMDKMSSSWKGFDLYCGATNSFRHWLGSLDFYVPEESILLNAMPQLDLLHDSNYFMKTRPKFFKKMGIGNDTKTILFFGNRCSTRRDYLPYIKDYFDTLFFIEKLARKNNWFVLVRPKNSLKKTLSCLSSISNISGYEWATSYIPRYQKIIKSSSVFVLDESVCLSPYEYFFADLILSCGTSTVEVEASVAERPIVIYNSKNKEKKYYDSLKSIFFGAATEVVSLDKIEEAIVSSMNDNLFAQRQRDYLKKVGIMNDGQASTRVVDKIIDIICD